MPGDAPPRCWIAQKFPAFLTPVVIATWGKSGTAQTSITIVNMLSHVTSSTSHMRLKRHQASLAKAGSSTGVL
jgi:hypothetical protein